MDGIAFLGLGMVLVDAAGMDGHLGHLLLLVLSVWCFTESTCGPTLGANDAVTTQGRDVLHFVRILVGKATRFANDSDKHGYKLIHFLWHCLFQNIKYIIKAPYI